MGEDSRFPILDEHIFQLGWFNQLLVACFWSPSSEARVDPGIPPSGWWLVQVQGGKKGGTRGIYWIYALTQ